MPDGSKQEYGVDGKLLRVIEPGVNIKKAKGDIIAAKSSDFHAVGARPKSEPITGIRDLDQGFPR